MRLVTRGDLDGAASAVLITTMEEIDSIELVHPQDITNKKFEITGNDIMANLPYHPKCGMWFDHHELTQSNEQPPAVYKGRHALAQSVARVIYDYYASEKLKRFEHFIAETDRFDSAQLSMQDVIDPKDVVLLGFTIDSRSGIGSFKGYFMKLVEWLKAMPVSEVLLKPEVQERVRTMKEQNSSFMEILQKHSKKDGNVVITDFRPLEKIPVGNRFLIYTLFPETNVSVRLQWGPEKKFVATTLGHNIFNRTSKANCGQICGQFGGGGHKGAGAVPIKTEEAEQKIAEIIRLLKAAG